MNDFNFFASFLIEQKKERKKNSLNIYSVIALILLLAILISAAFNFIRLRQIHGSIEESDAFLNDPNNISKLEEVDEISESIARIQNDSKMLSDVNEQIKNNRSVIINVLDFMNGQVTEDMYFKDLDISNREILVSGISITKEQIAQFEYNVRNSGYFDNMFVENIRKAERDEISEQLSDEVGRYIYSFDSSFLAKDSLYEDMKTSSYMTEKEDEVEESNVDEEVTNE